VVAGVLDGLDLAEAHRDLQPGAVADRGLGGAGAAALGLGQQVVDVLLQPCRVARGVRDGQVAHGSCLSIKRKMDSSRRGDPWMAQALFGF
jgi:hypothetical protein